MKIVITENAAKKIENYRKEKQGFLKLKYDTEDCGCVMCGVPYLWIVSEIDQGDYEIQTNHGGILIEKSKEVFFDEELTIDFNENAHCFQLKSPNQYINPRMGLLDKTI
jgi:uncharacterized protein YqkB